MNKIITKLKDAWSKITGYGPKLYNSLTVIYKAVYTLNALLEAAITSAEALGLDSTTVVKITGYVNKIQQYIAAAAEKFGISLDVEFTDEIKSLVEDQSIPFPKAAAKRAKLTLDDVIRSQGAAFDKLDELLTD